MPNLDSQLWDLILNNEDSSDDIENEKNIDTLIWDLSLQSNSRSYERKQSNRAEIPVFPSPPSGQTIRLRGGKAYFSGRAPF